MQEPEIYEETKKSFVALNVQSSMSQLIKFMSWRDNEVILDYGSGAGSTCAKYLVPQNSTSMIHGVDISKEMVAYAKVNFPHPRVTYHVGDIMDNELKNAPWKQLKYDKIVSMYVLHFIRDTREAFKRLFDLLKPGGLLGFLVNAKGVQFPVYRLLGQDSRFAPYLKGFETFIPKWFEEQEGNSEFAEKFICSVAQEAGFNVKWCELGRKSHVNQRLDTLTEHYYSLMPWIKNVPQELHDEVRKVIRQYLCDLNQCDVTATFIEDHHEFLTVVLQKPLEHGEEQQN